MSRVLWDTDLVGSRFTLGLAEFLWGFLLLWPNKLIVLSGLVPGLTFVPSYVGGLIMIATGICQFVILLGNDMHTKFARHFATWNTLVWVVVVYGLVSSKYPPPSSTGGGLALALSAFWIWVRPYILVEGHKRVNHTRSSPPTSPTPFN